MTNETSNIKNDLNENNNGNFKENSENNINESTINLYNVNYVTDDNTILAKNNNNTQIIKKYKKLHINDTIVNINDTV